MIRPAIGWRPFLFLSALILLAVLPACNVQKCDKGAVCNLSNGSGPSALPSPSASATPEKPATPTPTPAESCEFDILRLQPVGGLVVTIGQADAKLSLTPYQTLTCKAGDARVECAGKPEGSRPLHEVAESCNLQVRRLETLKWLNSAPDVVTVGLGYEPPVTRKKAGEAVVQATLEGLPSNAVTIR